MSIIQQSLSEMASSIHVKEVLSFSLNAEVTMLKFSFSSIIFLYSSSAYSSCRSCKETLENRNKAQTYLVSVYWRSKMV